MGNLPEKPLEQYRKPEGEMGKLVVQDMDENHYELTSWGFEQVKIDPKYSILDIGCGGGRTLARLAQMATDGKVFGIDYSEDCVRWASERNKEEIDGGYVFICQASVEKLPFESSSFDMAFAVETTYFWPNLEKNFTEACRVLKKQGQFVIINEAYICNAFRERNDEFQRVGKMKILSQDELETLLKKAGFSHVDTKIREDKKGICCIAIK